MGCNFRGQKSEKLPIYMSVVFVGYVLQVIDFIYIILEMCLKINFLTDRFHYSHSIVAGGFELTSYTTRFTPRTLFMMSLLTFARKS